MSLSRLRRRRDVSHALVPVLLAALLLPGLGWAAVAVGAGAGPAPAAKAKKGSIKLGKGLAGVKIGMTEKQVKKKLGRPDEKYTVQAAFGPGHPVLYRYRKLDVEFWKGAPRNPSGSKPPDKKLRVAVMSTTRKSEETDRGIGVGSTEAQVKKNVPGVKCETLKFNGKSYRNCHTGSYTCKPPSWVLGDLPCHVNAFVLDRKHNGRVERVQVGWLGSPSGKLYHY